MSASQFYTRHWLVLRVSWLTFWIGVGVGRVLIQGQWPPVLAIAIAVLSVGVYLAHMSYEWQIRHRKEPWTSWS